MSSLIVVCRRDPARPFPVDDLRRCATALAPDNIRPNPPLIDAVGRSAIVVVNPVSSVTACESGVCLGRMFGSPGDWWRIGSEAPEGNYVIARRHADALEVLTDVLATRQTWYVHTPEVFLASTSQRALVMLLRSFELDPESLTWMLTSGHLGAKSWDARLRRLPGDCRLILDLERWNLRLIERPAVRDPLPVSDTEHIARLRDAILETCAEMHLPLDECLLPLSGGLDSRALLLGLIHAGERPRCVTWGRRSAMLDPANDAYIARELARKYGLEHSYWPTDESSESIEVAMQRFLTMSEGQVCDFGGYVDGMAMWKAFFETGTAGVIRGDEPGIGDLLRCDSEAQILRMAGRILVSEYPEDHPIHRLGLTEVELDESLRRRPEESLRAWDARLDEEDFHPATLAPLTTIKTAYVEVVNPLMSRRVTEVARRLPDHLRVHREPLRALVASLGPDLPLAKAGALGKGTAFWCNERGLASMRRTLERDDAERVLSRPALDVVLAGLAHPPPASSAARGVKGVVRALVPKRLIERVRPVWPLRLDGRELAFRAYVAVRTAGLLTGDAGWLGSVGRESRG